MTHVNGSMLFLRVGHMCSMQTNLSKLLKLSPDYKVYSLKKNDIPP